MEIAVGSVDDVRRDGCRLVTVEGRQVGVISVGDAFYAVSDRCPHMGASMCTGSLGGTFVPSAPHELRYGLDERVLRCPWHGWEFDLETGRPAFGAGTGFTRTYTVQLERGRVQVMYPSTDKSAN